MTLTRANVLDRAASLIGDDSTAFRTYAETALNNCLFYLWDIHDWEFKHKIGTFNTVSGTESYNLATPTPDIRSAQDIEVLYDKTNGRFLKKVDLKDIRKYNPQETSTSQPMSYAPWGTKTIYLHNNPDGIYVMKYLYTSKPTLPTADANDLETTCALPDYMHHVIDKMTMAEMLLYTDDSRYAAIKQEIEQLLIPRAIAADMKHLESTARFKFWDEELSHSGGSYDSFISRSFWSEDY